MDPLLITAYHHGYARVLGRLRLSRGDSSLSQEKSDGARFHLSFAPIDASEGDGWSLDLGRGLYGAWRLRLPGNAVLAVYNRAYDPVGRDPGTGTTHPDVVRELARQARR